MLTSNILKKKKSKFNVFSISMTTITTYLFSMTTITTYL